ncbi:hypothetical protein CDAR_28561 [Caerostris darwini]|uniref:Histone H2A n=1 Tax=Caerostris darwini TaxID=1538125 RepID=A0AAV4Q4Y9_9ARAC|nr:hypothetical protein CDAR_28561 [Caerostris darwini]
MAKKSIKKPIKKSKKAITTKKHKGASTKKPAKPPLDVMFIHSCLQNNFRKTVDPCASFVLEGVLQYLGAEILELSYRAAQNRCKNSGHSIVITESDIIAAVENDNDMKALIR